MVILDVPIGGGAPDFVSSIRGAGAPNFLSTPGQISVFDDFAYIPAQGENGLTIIDISTPAIPVYAGGIYGAGAPNYLSNCISCHVRNNGFCYVVSLNDDSLSIIDVSDPTAPTLSGVIRGAGAPNFLNGPRDIFVDDNLIAYVAVSLDNSLSIFDVSDPSAPAFLGNIAGVGGPNFLQNTLTVRVSGTRAYLQSFNQRTFSIFDITDPANPTFLGFIDAGAIMTGPRGITVSGNTLYLASQTGPTGDGSLAIFDITDPAAIALLGSLVDVRFRGPRGLVFLDSGSPRIMILGSNATADSVAHVNVTDPAAPAFVDNINGSGAPHFITTPQYIALGQTLPPIVATNPATGVT